MKKKMLVWVLGLGLMLLAGCDSRESLSGTRTSTDHFSENRGSGEVIGDVQMTAVTSGDIVTVTFAPPAADWKDPRGQKIPSPSPVPFLAQAGCKLTGKKGEKMSQLDPGQVCETENRKLTITLGNVYLQKGVLNATIYGKLDSGPDYSFSYPQRLDTDEPLKAN